MGCDIHMNVEVNGKHVDIDVLEERSYGVFGFLADVRNYSCVPVIGAVQGVPKDISKETKENLEYWDGDAHSHHWIMLKQLLDFDYKQIFEDRRFTEKTGNCYNGAAIAEPGNGVKVTYREFLGDWFFEDLKKLKELGNPETIKLIFWFDN